MNAQSSTVDVYTVTGDRVVATVAALVALFGLIVGAIALARGSRGRGPTAALVAGPAGVIAGGLVVALADGGPGTGNGIVGGYAALVLGAIATVLGILALVRPARAGLDHRDRKS